MKLEIRIPDIGEQIGTCGWLAKGLSAGTIKFVVGTTTFHGQTSPCLDLKTLSGNQPLAEFNPYRIKASERLDEQRFFTADKIDGCFGGGRHLPWTDAAWDYLMEIAGDWCTRCNALLENDKDTKLRTLSVSIG